MHFLAKYLYDLFLNKDEPILRVVRNSNIELDEMISTLKPNMK